MSLVKKPKFALFLTPSLNGNRHHEAILSSNPHDFNTEVVMFDHGSIGLQHGVSLQQFYVFSLYRKMKIIATSFPLGPIGLVDPVGCQTNRPRTHVVTGRLLLLSDAQLLEGPPSCALILT